MSQRHFEFHVSRQSRDHYQFDQSLFQFTGNVIFANFHAARVFAQRMNDKRDLINYPEQAVKAGQINAMGLIDEISHLVIELYRRQVNPSIMRNALQALEAQFGPNSLDTVLHRFSQEFPPLAVYRQEKTLDEWFQGSTNGISHRELALEEMLMLWLANMNPAFSPFIELFDDRTVEKQTVYPQIFPALQEFFAGQPGFGPDGENLMSVLRAPALAAPHSLTAQLEFIRQRWGGLLGKSLYRLLGSLDLIQEEEKVIWVGGDPGPALLPEYGSLDEEPERYTTDKDWMPNLVLIAKNAYVWLDQLSREYGQEIRHLDQVPDKELDRLARFGFTGLWLIGLWERSEASKRIKQLTGNPEAVASAYSLMDYRIAGDLGGDPAVENLRKRAWDRGIRLASDMVPNHMGIDSYWVMDHPEWFLSLPYSPFPSYSFNGPNLSWNDRVGIYLEDHYYNRSDAAVVFKRVDHHTGDTRYIYHGNDGTTMPWNDTAQLNYLMPEVREAVIQTILHVARQFPVIRFDAAMTLAKRHIQRLWFPEPGTGGAIATRSDFGLTRQQFDELNPVEFWREVVDRAAVEAPNTLLLAEAFWMLEGYFVRTLGMHRVYNSAFMHMIRDEDNAKYRVLIKSTLEFDPEILKRYVNFMNNPDEKTAVEQFGKGDKYIAVCTLMLTLPGLPMFGHGQIEGYGEKYGMEYRRAYWDELPDSWLVERHEREIVPLIRRRYLFAGVENYYLYDFINTDGSINEDVFAYSNQVGSERALVVVHNKYATARGSIQTSVAFLARTGNGDEKTLQRRSLSEGMEISGEANRYTIFRDHSNGLEYIRPNSELASQGLYLELHAYNVHVFLDFREVEDNEWHHYKNLVAYLGGQGVPSISEALRETFLQPIHAPYRELVNADLIQRIITLKNETKTEEVLPETEIVEALPDEIALPVEDLEPAMITTPVLDGVLDGVENEEEVEEVEVDAREALLDEVEEKVLRLAQEIKAYTEGTGDEVALAHEVRTRLDILLQVETVPVSSIPDYEKAIDYIQSSLDDDEWSWTAILIWLFTEPLGKLVTTTGYEEQTRSWVDEWLLRKIITETFLALGADESGAARGLMLVKALTGQQGDLRAPTGKTKPAYRVLESWLKDDDARGFLKVNRYQEVLWYNKEAFDQLLALVLLAEILEEASQPATTLPEATRQAVDPYSIVQVLRDAQAESDYRVEKLLAAVRKS